MRHFMLALSSDIPAPTKLGDEVSWFRFYKLNADDHVWIPRMPGFELLLAGDALWVSFDTELIGYYIIERVEPDALNDRDELWFDSRKIKHTLVGFTSYFPTGLLEEENAARLLERTEEQ